MPLPVRATLLGLIGACLLLLPGLAAAPIAPAQGPAAVPISLTPAETAVTFYAALEAREFAAAYAFLSPSAQAERPFADWSNGYLTTQHIDVQAAAGDAPDSVHVDLWVSDGELPRVHGYTGTWWLVPGATGLGWLLDRAQLDEGPAPTFPFAPRPNERCTPPNPEPATATQCQVQLNVPVPAGAILTLTSIGPQPLGGPVNLVCDSVTGGLSCLPPTGPPSPFGARLVCAPSPPADACPAEAGFKVGLLSLNGGPLSEALTIAPAQDGTSPTFLVVPSPPVSFTTLVPAPPPSRP